VHLLVLSMSSMHSYLGAEGCAQQQLVQHNLAASKSIVFECITTAMLHVR
jgi:hypothetical protein